MTMKKEKKKYYNDFIVVKELRKHSRVPNYEEYEYTTDTLMLSKDNPCMTNSVSDSSFEDCIKSAEEKILLDLKMSKDKRRFDYNPCYDAKLLSVKLIRVKTTIEETVEDSISFEDEIKGVA